MNLTATVGRTSSKQAIDFAVGKNYGSHPHRVSEYIWPNCRPSSRIWRNPRTTNPNQRLGIVISFLSNAKIMTFSAEDPLLNMGACPLCASVGDELWGCPLALTNDPPRLWPSTPTGWTPEAVDRMTLCSKPWWNNSSMAQNLMVASGIYSGMRADSCFS